MLKIVHFAKYYHPETGGIESVTSSLAEGAAKAGHHVSVVCFTNSGTRATLMMNAVRIVRVPVQKLIAAQPLSLWYFWLCIRSAFHADIVHLHAPNMLAALSSLFVSSRKRMVVHWHSDVLGKGMLGILTRPLELMLLSRADTIVTTSQVYADASIALQPFLHKVQVVPIGVPDHTLANIPPPSQLQPVLDQVAGRKIVLAVGRLVPYKGFDILVDASRQIREDAVVVIVGSGPLQSELQQQIDQAGLQDRVLLVGGLSFSDLHGLFKHAYLYCLSSINRAEAFGVVLAEALSYGLPVVAPRITGSGVSWVNEHGVTGLNVAVADPWALADACNAIISNPLKKQSFAKNARNRFLSMFTEEASVQQMLKVYARTLQVQLVAQVVPKNETEHLDGYTEDEAQATHPIRSERFVDHQR